MNNIKIDLVKKSYEELQELVIQFMTDKFILKTQLETYENMRKSAIEYIKFNATSNYFDSEKNMFRREEDLLNILNKVGEDNENGS